MYIDMEKYKKKDIKSVSGKSLIEGFELALEDIDYALSNYEDEYDESLPTMTKMCLEVAKDFAEYLKHYMGCTRDELLVSILDEERC